MFSPKVNIKLHVIFKIIYVVREFCAKSLKIDLFIHLIMYKIHIQVQNFYFGFVYFSTGN